MKRDEKFALAGLIGVVMAIAFAFMAYRNVLIFAFEFRREYAAHNAVLEDRLNDLEAREDLNAQSWGHADRELSLQRDRIGSLRLDLDGVMRRKPPTVEDTGWAIYRFNRGGATDRRVGARTLEAAMNIPDGSLWRDKDKRSASGNRIVRVTLVAFGYVTYANKHDDKTRHRSRIDRFVKAFERVDQEVAATTS